jgi:hypothetical protein
VRWWLVRWRSERGWTMRQYPITMDSVPWPRLADGRAATDVALEFLAPNGVGLGTYTLDVAP